MSRIVCTKDNPSDGEPYKWVHPDAKCIYTYDAWEEGDSYDEYECPHCGKKFKEYTGK